MSRALAGLFLSLDHLGTGITAIRYEDSQFLLVKLIRCCLLSKVEINNLELVVPLKGPYDLGLVLF